jgi:hypothetical protein
MTTISGSRYGSAMSNAAWKSVSEPGEELSTAVQVGHDDWVRLVPVLGLERAMKSAPTRPLVLDRKCAPSFDLTGGLPGEDLVASERVVRSLERHGASGFRAKLVPHATPNRVHGHIHYVLSSDGVAGRIVDGSPTPADPAALRPPPTAPVTFDATTGSGDDLCLSERLGIGGIGWRALVVRGSVYLGLVEDLGHPTLGAERVVVHGARPRGERARGVVEGTAEAPDDPRSIAELIALLRQDAPRNHHELPPPSDDAARSGVEALAGFALPRAYAEILRATDGANLFGGELWFFRASPGKRSVAAERTWTRRPGTQYPYKDEWLPIAATSEQEIVWAIDRDGVVRGLGREGIVYGPDVPFDAWLADQIADLRWAAERERS